MNIENLTTIKEFEHVIQCNQGDLGKQKGAYHINAVYDVTQFEVVY
ncbi:hypothetical protein [uncultured Paraglaciecola sp.]